MLKRSQPIFAVKDVKATIAFYENVLGFGSPWFWGDPVCFGGIQRDSVQVMFNQQPDLAAKIEGHQHHFWVDDLDGLHARHIAAGAPIIEPIGNRPWGLREYTVRDPNGYHLRFSGPTTYVKPATALDTMPAYIRIESRLPTGAEFIALAASVGWKKTAESSRWLAGSLLGVVAIDKSSDEAVGMARAVEDAYGWYSIWDVVVRPVFQSQRIGTAMMESLLDQLRRRGPAGATVNLFTFHSSFYERMGFAQNTCTSLKL